MLPLCGESLSAYDDRDARRDKEAGCLVGVSCGWADFGGPGSRLKHPPREIA